MEIEILYLLPKIKHPYYNLIKKPASHRLGMSEFGNGVAVAIEAL
jgi:hypothetical protein